MRDGEAKLGQRVSWPNPEALGGTRRLRGVVVDPDHRQTGYKRVQVRRDGARNAELVSPSNLRPER